MASPSASERRSFTYARWVLYGSTRGGAGGFSWSWPAGKPHRGHSHWSGIAASDAKLGRVSCVFEHQNDTQTRGAASPRSASPIGPAPTRLPRIALPLLTESHLYALTLDACLPAVCLNEARSLTKRAADPPAYFISPPVPPSCWQNTHRLQWLMSQPRATTHTNQSTPKKIVIRSRFRSTTDDEPRVEDTPPPNRSDRPPPLPLCRRTSRIITSDVMIKMTESAISTGCLLSP